MKVKEKVTNVSVSMVLECADFTRPYGSYRVQIHRHYSHQETLYCCEKSQQFIHVSNHYTLFLKINVS